MAMVEVARRYPEARLLYTGAAASITRALLARKGFDVGRVVFEPEARPTYENVALEETGRSEAKERRLLVTSPATMPRAVGVFRAAGWSIVPYPVDHRTTARIRLDHRPNAGTASRLADLDLATHEWIGLIAYYLIGRTRELLSCPVAPGLCGTAYRDVANR